MIRLILFDLDGVLIDAKEIHYEALNEALGELSISRSEHINFYDGKPTRKKLLYLTERKGLPLSSHEEVYAKKQEATIKLIIGHSLLVNSIPQEFDMIVRARFDTHIFKNANFSEFIQRSFSNNCAIGFAATSKPLFGELRRTPADSQRHWIWDQLIIHPRKLLSHKRVMRLHEQRKLHAAEMGWFQVLSLPYGSNHENWQGWVNHDKGILGKFFY